MCADRKTVKQNGHQHFEKDIVTTKTLVQNEVETVSTTTYTEVIDTYTCTTVIDEEVIPTPERSLAMNQQQTTTTKTEIAKSVDSIFQRIGFNIVFVWTKKTC
jgi:hypothetical protein